MKDGRAKKDEENKREDERTKGWRWRDMERKKCEMKYKRRKCKKTVTETGRKMGE